MFTNNKAAYYLKAATSVILLLLLCRWTWVVFSRSAGEYTDYLLYTTGRNTIIDKASYPFIPTAFIALKIILILASIGLGYHVYRIIKHDVPLLHSITNKYFYGLAEAIINIPRFFASLDAGIRMLFLLLLIAQGAVLAYLLFYMPYHYDEMLNYMSFSGRGLLADISYYPVPNNHILYSISASLSLMSKLDTITAIRLPNVLISFFTTYFFFKTVSQVINPKVALIASVVMVFSFPFIMYNVQGRGYAFFLFFTVLLLYAFTQLIAGNRIHRYTTIYAAAAILGAYTIPTFIYVLIPFSFVLFIFSLFNKDIFSVLSFIRLHIAIGIITFLLYLPLFLVNGWDVFQKAEELGVKPIQPPYTSENVKKHIADTWQFLVSGIILPYYVIGLLAIAPFIYAYRRQQLQKYFAIILSFLLVSPLLIITLQKSIPFPRTWMHIIVPIGIGAGIIIGGIIAFAAKKREKVQTVTIAILISIYSIIFIKRIESNYRSSYAVDYTVRDYVRFLQEKLPAIHTIQRTNDLSFYLAEDLQFEAHRRKMSILLQVISEVDAQTAELIISTPDANFPIGNNYELVPVDNPYFQVYIRKGL